MATTCMDMNQADIFLTSQTKKREGAISDDQAKVLLKFWKSNNNKVHQSLVEKSSWNDNLKSLSWRIDMKNQSRHKGQLGESTAIMELQLENKHVNKVNINLCTIEYSYTVAAFIR